jgi:hypothetical protein
MLCELTNAELAEHFIMTKLTSEFDQEATRIREEEALAVSALGMVKKRNRGRDGR